MSLFVLGAIDPFLVSRYSGFDRSSFVQQVRLLDDGVASSPNVVLQSSGIPGRTAQITGTLTESTDCDLLRDYQRDVTAVGFIDGNAVAYNVIVTDLAIEDYTHWWTFSATLYCTDEDGVGS